MAIIVTRKTKHDPTVDPRPGDDLEKSNKRWITRREVISAGNGAVRFYEHDRAGSYWIRDCLLTSWRKWAKSAEVLHVAD